jgi:hypothetical protein
MSCLSSRRQLLVLQLKECVGGEHTPHHIKPACYEMLFRASDLEGTTQRARCIWKDNTKVDLRGVGLEGVGWIHLAQDRDQWWAFMNTVRNLFCSVKDGEFLV